MKRFLYNAIKYLIKVTIITLIFAGIAKYVLSLEDISILNILLIGALVVALVSVLTKSKRHRINYDNHMQSFYFEERRKNF